MEIDDSHLFNFMQDVRGSLGRLEEGQSNTTRHLEAVSDKANTIRAELSSHKESQDAHGSAAASKRVSGIVPWIALLVSGLGLLFKNDK